ncbi:MAG: hypothetical protein RL758_639 [Pseudomonadota bacterium]|jgi:hypothetical protein
MPRNITVTFEDGSTHVYRNAPDNVSPAQVSQRAQQEFGKSVKALDGGRKPAVKQPTIGERVTTSVKGVAGGILEGLGSVLDIPASAGNLVSRGVTMGLATVGEPVLRGVGATGAANALMRAGQDAERGTGAYRNYSMAEQVVKALPETATSPSRLGGNVLGGAAVPFGPKAKAPLPQAPTVIAKAAPTAAGAVVEAGKRAGVRVLTSDVKPPKTAIGRSAQKLGEMIPIAGTGGVRAAQQGERQAAVEAFAKEFGAADGVIDDVTKSLVVKRGAELTKLTGAKTGVINALDGQEVPMLNTITALDKKIAELSARKTDLSAAVVSELERIKAQISGKTLPQVEALRADELSGIFKRNDLGHIRDLGEKALRPIYTALNDDMGAFIKQAGGQPAYIKWKGANTRLSMMAGELKGNQLAGVLKTADATPENVSRLLFSTKPSDIRRLYNGLDGKGRAKAQAALVFRALEKSSDDASKQISPDKFLNAINVLSKSTGVFFQQGDKLRIEGLKRVLDATRRAGQAGVVPNNGSQVVPYAIPAVLTQVFGLQGGITVAGAAGGAARAYESAAVRDALLKLGRSKAGSPQEAIQLNRVATALSAALEGRIGNALNDNTRANLVAAQPPEEQEQQAPLQ